MLRHASDGRPDAWPQLLATCYILWMSKEGVAGLQGVMYTAGRTPKQLHMQLQPTRPTPHTQHVGTEIVSIYVSLV